MTYDIHLVRQLPGRTVAESLDEYAAAAPAGPTDLPPMSLSHDQRAVWARVVRRAAGELGPVTVEEYPAVLTLWRDGPVHFYQVDYAGEWAHVEIPYRYPGSAALAVVEEAYRMVRIVEEETGLAGFDGEVSQDVRTGDVGTAAARLGGVSRWAWDTLV